MDARQHRSMAQAHVPAAPPERPKPPTVFQIALACAERSGVSMAEIEGRKAHQRYARVRQLVMLLARETCPERSYPTIGRLLDRDHRTVMAGIRAARRRLKTDPDYRRLYEAVRQKLRLDTGATNDG